MGKKGKLANGTGSVYKLSGNRKKPWAARKTVGKNERGQQIYKFIGFYRTRTEAMHALLEFNKNPYSLHGERLCDMYEKFISDYAKTHKPKTVGNIEIAWDHLSPLHDEAIAKLTRKTLQIFFDELKATKQVKEKVRSVLRQIMSYSIRYDIVQPERIAIFDYIDLKSTAEERVVDRKPFTEAEIRRLEEINDGMSHILLFLICTGLRAGEFCSLTDESIDEDMVIHVTDSKTAAGVRAIPLSDYALKLVPVPHFDDYYKLKYRFAVWRQKYEFGHTLHDTRHTCASLLANAQVDKRVVQAILGHKGLDVTDKVYTHISNEVMREALNRILPVTYPVSYDLKITHDNK